MFATREVKKQKQNFLTDSRKSDEHSGVAHHQISNPTQLRQRSLGNYYLQAVTNSPEAVGTSIALTGEPRIQRACTCGGACGKCGDKEDELKGIQTKLTISEPGDIYEQEADRVADQVMRMPDPEGLLQSLATGTGRRLQRLCSNCTTELAHDEVVEDEEENKKPVDLAMPEPGEIVEEEEEVAQLESPAVERNPGNRIQRMFAKCEQENDRQSLTVLGQTAADSPSARIVHDGGAPLTPSLRAFFEPRFGYTFDKVRVHTDVRGAQSARAVNALAYTLGDHIVFGAGQYTPDTSAGRRLLAHELTHVVQQNPTHTPTQPADRQNVRLQTAVNGGQIVQRWSIGAPVAGINTIICNGSGGVTTQLGATGNATQTTCLRDCIQVHEESHRADAIAENANICNGITAGNTVRPNAGAQQRATEIRASNAEIACLRGRLAGANATCRPIITSRITQMEAYRDSFT